MRFTSKDMAFMSIIAAIRLSFSILALTFVAVGARIVDDVREHYGLRSASS
jgi:hypothetical protein